MKICVMCRNEILGEEYFVSSIFSSEEQGSCCSECYEICGKIEKKIQKRELGKDYSEPKTEGRSFKGYNHAEDEMELVIDKNKQLIFFKKGDRPMMTIYGNYKSFLDGLDTNFPIVNVYGNNLDGNHTSVGIWMITYDKEMDITFGNIWVESNHLGNSDLPF